MRFAFRETHNHDHSLGWVLGLTPWPGGCHIMGMGAGKDLAALAASSGHVVHVQKLERALGAFAVRNSAAHRSTDPLEEGGRSLAGIVSGCA